jgi:hypothetical protein
MHCIESYVVHVVVVVVESSWWLKARIWLKYRIDSRIDYVGSKAMRQGKRDKRDKIKRCDDGWNNQTIRWNYQMSAMATRAWRMHASIIWLASSVGKVFIRPHRPL